MSLVNPSWRNDRVVVSRAQKALEDAFFGSLTPWIYLLKHRHLLRIRPLPSRLWPGIRAIASHLSRPWRSKQRSTWRWRVKYKQNTLWLSCVVTNTLENRSMHPFWYILATSTGINTKSVLCILQAVNHDARNFRMHVRLNAKYRHWTRLYTDGHHLQCSVHFKRVHMVSQNEMRNPVRSLRSISWSFKSSHNTELGCNANSKHYTRLYTDVH